MPRSLPNLHMNTSLVEGSVSGWCNGSVSVRSHPMSMRTVALVDAQICQGARGRPARNANLTVMRASIT